MRKLGDYLLGFSVAFSVVCMMCLLAYFTNQSDKAIDEQMKREVNRTLQQRDYKSEDMKMGVNK
jgi:hypothetical protein